MKYIVFIFALAIISCNNTPKSDTQKEYLRHVGDIPADSKLDLMSFRPCKEEYATVYYAFDKPDLYKGEKPAMIKPFLDLAFPRIKGETGYITIRFMVNCEGRTGRFRVEQLDIEYKDKKFNPKIVESILSTTMSLDGWIPGKFDERAYDYYKYLTFKIIDNQINEILP
jgi:hypothetical protein